LITAEARTKDYFLSRFRRCGVTPIVRYSSMSYETVRDLVARGEGFSVLNTMPATPVAWLGDRLPPLAASSWLRQYAASAYSRPPAWIVPSPA
jgi:DNA-binding transcriptional LysR family regulator